MAYGNAKFGFCPRYKEKRAESDSVIEHLSGICEPLNSIHNMVKKISF
jgi:hypothetical protein